MAFKDMPYGIDFVVEQDLVPLGIKKIPNSKGYNFNCPFCAKALGKQDKHHKYSVNIYKNVGHCFKCGASHGVLSLHAELCGLTLKEAAEDLDKRWNNLPVDTKTKLSQVKDKLEEENSKQLEPAPTEILDDIYKKFLNQLTLSDKHKQDLLKRGLNEEQIEKGMYKTVPQVGFVSIAKNCFDYETKDVFKRHYKWGVPGFYDIRKEPKFVRCDSGYFVPVRNEFGQIAGMQIRYDALKEGASEEKKNHYAKYKWFTSNFRELEGGCSATGCENIHYASYSQFNSNLKTVMLTEGVLKADVASYLGGKIKGKEPIPILGLVGVYNTQNLNFELAKLKMKGLEKVIIAVDMDYLEKKQVAQALADIESRIEEVGLKHEMFKWDPKYKGIDDFLLEVSMK